MSTPASVDPVTCVRWADVEDYTDIMGPVTDTERLERMLCRATEAAASYLCWAYEAREDVPLDVVMAIVSLAGRVMTSSPGGSSGQVVGETIGGYSYRLGTATPAETAFRITPDIAALLNPHSSCADGGRWSIASPVVCQPCQAGCVETPASWTASPYR